MPASIADKDNVLIDNLPPRYNDSKMSMMGIVTKNYYQTREYYGVNFHEEDFVAGIKEFIESRR